MMRAELPEREGSSLVTFFHGIRDETTKIPKVQAGTIPKKLYKYISIC